MRIFHPPSYPAMVATDGLAQQIAKVTGFQDLGFEGSICPGCIRVFRGSIIGLRLGEGFRL